MRFGRRIKMIAAIALLLVSGVGGGLSGDLADVLAAEDEMVSTGDETDSAGDEADSIEDETDATGDETDASDGEVDSSEDETDAIDDETDSSDNEADSTEDEADSIDDKTDTSDDETDSSEDETDSSDDKTDSSVDEEIPSPMEMVVPIYDYDILNVLVPTSYAVAFNPYGLNIRVDEDDYFSGQVISRNYGIVNASARDKLVTVTLTVEDLNDGEITFVDSAEAVRDADAETFAVSLALVPADDREITVNNRKVDKNITTESLTDVSMGKSTKNAVTLHAGENQVTFKLSGAVYDFSDSDGPSPDDEDSHADSFRLMKLAADGTGVTAFTFDGAMNPNADWTKLQRGIRLSVVYDYENTTGTEMIAEGTGAMVRIDGE